VATFIAAEKKSRREKWRRGGVGGDVLLVNCKVRIPSKTESCWGQRPRGYLHNGSL
jgi:hypothetical protein